MRIFCISLFCFFVISFSASAQQITIVEQPDVARMMERFKTNNKAVKTIDGWRIQILATADRQRMESTRQSFQYRYPNVSTDWIHSNPYYKLRVGAFATKLEMDEMLSMIKRDYPGAYGVRDTQIKPEELLSSDQFDK